MYHSVAQPAVDPWRLSVSPANFAKHLEVLKQYTRPITLNELSAGYRTAKLPSPAVVVTFDDGYANNLNYALPLLEQQNIPATVFVSTGYLDGRNLFWWDELARLFLQTVYLPQTLSLTINGFPHHWHLRDASIYPLPEQERYADWTYKKDPPTLRHTLLLQLWRQIYPCNRQERQRILSQLLAWAGIKPLAPSDQRPMNSEELQRLSHSELMTIGAHTVNHIALETLSPAVQRAEIAQSKQDLEQTIKAPIKHFAYPHGAFNHKTVDILRESGFITACSVTPGPVRQKSDPFQLPRVQIMDWNRTQFEQYIANWVLDFA